MTYNASSLLQLPDTRPNVDRRKLFKRVTPPGGMASDAEKKGTRCEVIPPFLRNAVSLITLHSRPSRASNYQITETEPDSMEMKDGI
jgi:hypothetical protein